MKKEKIYSMCVGVLFIDQIVKAIVTLKMKLHQSIVIIPNFFDLYYVQNTGAAFSILKDMRYLLIGFSILVFFAIQRYISLTKIQNKLEIISLTSLKLILNSDPEKLFSVIETVSIYVSSESNM